MTKGSEVILEHEQPSRYQILNTETGAWKLSITIFKQLKSTDNKTVKRCGPGSSKKHRSQTDINSPIKILHTDQKSLFISNLEKPACASKQDVLELTILQYVVSDWLDLWIVPFLYFNQILD